MYIEYSPIDPFDEAEQNLQYPTAEGPTIGFGYSVGGSGSDSGIVGSQQLTNNYNNINHNGPDDFDFDNDNDIQQQDAPGYADDFDIDCENLSIVQNSDGFFELKKNHHGRPATTFKRKCISKFPSKNLKKLNFLKTIKRRGSGSGNSQTNINNGKSSIPMGLDILAKIWNLFGDSSSSSDGGAFGRKRRADDNNWNSASTQLKYRRVDNEFPKIVKKSFEEDEIKIVPQRLQKTPLVMAQQNQKEKRSQFVRPRTVTKHLTNTNYADIEFSDDEEIIFPSSRGGIVPQSIMSRQGIPRSNIMPSTSSSSSSIKMTNIPYKQRPQPPPLIQASTGDILASTLMPDLQPIRQYSSILSACANGFDGAVAGNIIHQQRSSVAQNQSSSIRKTTASPFQFNGNLLKVNNFSSSSKLVGGARSILDRENNSKGQEQYRELLEKLVPTLYGINKSSSPKLPLPTKSSRLSINRTKETTVPIDISAAVVERSTVTTSSLSRNRKAPSGGEVIATFELSDDEDDVSEIIELADDELNMLSACSKLQEDQAECTYDLKRRAAEKKKQLPYVEPVNSLKEKFDLSPVCQNDWLEKFTKKWNDKHREGKQKIAETEKEVEELSAETRDKEREMHQRLRDLQIVDPDLIVIDDFPEEDEEPEYPVLTPEHEAIIKNAAFGGPADQMLISKFSMSITRRDISTLLGKTWLNDEVINFYMNLLTERGELRASEGLPKVHAMNTFFVPRLLQSGHTGVRRWTRKVDIFSYDILPVPVHVGGVHWCMAIIHMRDRSIKYYDSMGTPNPKILSALEQYLREESLDKRKRPFDTSDFLIESVRNVPQQNNGSDCGVFSCMFAEFICRDREITFSQSNMDYFRHKMILEIVQGKLMQ